jgi:polar amino acid transport system substrate-binding protein
MFNHACLMERFQHRTPCTRHLTVSITRQEEKMQSETRSMAATAGTAVLALALVAGCSSSKSVTASTGGTGGTSVTSSGGVDAAAAAKVPAKFKSKGTLTIATDATYPPNENLDDSGKIVGFDVDLGQAIAAKLGLKANFTNVSFDNILGGVQSGSYDAAMSSITDTKDREGKNLKLVTYFMAGTKLMVPPGNPKHLTSTGPTDLSLCGLNIGVEKDTTQQDQVQKDLTDACTKAGKPAPKAVVQEKQSDVNTALLSGRTDAVLADSPVVDYYAKDGKFAAVGDAYESAPYGVMISGDNSDLADAFLAAVKDLQTDGTYQKITKQWGISSGDYTTPGINQAQS